MAVHIHEIQSPIHGRKSSLSGPRPIDPPPVVQLYFESGRQEVDCKRLLCKVDLFRMPEDQLAGELTYYKDKGRDRENLPVFGLVRTPVLDRPLPIEGRIGNHLLLRTSSETHLLLGPQPAEGHYAGPDLGVIFVFPSLGVQQTGKFVLRYSVFLMHGVTQPPQELASCVGVPFRVYHSGQFPGLQPSTPLTNALAAMDIPGISILVYATSEFALNCGHPPVLCGWRAENAAATNNMDPALLTRIDAVAENLVGMKLRVAGQVLAYDAYTGLAVLRDRDAAVVVDVALCVSAWASEWVGERLCTVTAVGYLERAPASEGGMRVPTLPKHVPVPRIEAGLVLRALLVVGRPELDMGLWHSALLGDNNNNGTKDAGGHDGS
ncbi:hypothetical protein DFH09DRAFT_1308114 [Mycena vulgaris]|nr:hypothetical protein DFH09DRAFT_1308114 [Mycena vulgaris]